MILTISIEGYTLETNGVNLELELLEFREITYCSWIAAWFQGNRNRKAQGIPFSKYKLQNEDSIFGAAQ